MREFEKGFTKFPGTVEYFLFTPEGIFLLTFPGELATITFGTHQNDSNEAIEEGEEYEEYIVVEVDAHQTREAGIGTAVRAARRYPSSAKRE
jgi:hypothetical protein